MPTQKRENTPEVKRYIARYAFPGGSRKFQDAHSFRRASTRAVFPAIHVRSSQDAETGRRTKQDRSWHQRMEGLMRLIRINSTAAPRRGSLRRARTSISGTKSEPMISARVALLSKREASPRAAAQVKHSRIRIVQDPR